MAENSTSNDTGTSISTVQTHFFREGDYTPLDRHPGVAFYVPDGSEVHRLLERLEAPSIFTHNHPADAGKKKLIQEFLMSAQIASTSHPWMFVFEANQGSAVFDFANSICQARPDSINLPYRERLSLDPAQYERFQEDGISIAWQRYSAQFSTLRNSPLLLRTVRAVRLAFASGVRVETEADFYSRLRRDIPVLRLKNVAVELPSVTLDEIHLNIDQKTQ